jgi:hypothetical protein
MNSHHFLVGCPRAFNLAESLKSAVSVRFAMAFAKRSGWKLFREALLDGTKEIEIVVGLSFWITDPTVLEEWLALTKDGSTQLKVRVADWSPTFHPKVLVARFADGSSFAIVGSGNLTGGGQHHNIECGVYLTQNDLIDELDTWIGNLKASPLSKQIIADYKPFFEKAKEVNSEASAARLAASLTGQGYWLRDAFISQLADFLETPTGQDALRDRIKGARQVRKALQMPSFNFDEQGFKHFYTTQQFGSIRQAYYSDLANNLPTLRRAMRFLTSKTVDADRLNSVFAGDHGIRGFGKNQITKVLTVYDRHKWPILNKPVASTLARYGYQIDWSAKGYLAFSADMRDALGTLGVPDFWALDAFCEVTYHDLQ